MDVREKLIELLSNIYFLMIDGPDTIGEYTIPHKFKEKIADHLISNGVTVQEWVSVDDRLPERDGAYLVTTNGVSGLQNVKTRWFAKDGEMVDAYDLAGQKDVWYLYDSECGYVSIKTVNHWMPLPEKPKGE